MPESWPLGQIIAVVDVVDCLKTDDCKPERLESYLGNYMPGRFAWVTSNLRRVKPYPYTGMQGLKPLAPEIEKALEYV